LFAKSALHVRQSTQTSFGWLIEAASKEVTVRILIATAIRAKPMEYRSRIRSQSHWCPAQTYSPSVYPASVAVYPPTIPGGYATQVPPPICWPVPMHADAGGRPIRLEFARAQSPPTPNYQPPPGPRGGSDANKQTHPNAIEPIIEGTGLSHRSTRTRRRSSPCATP